MCFHLTFDSEHLIASTPKECPCSVAVESLTLSDVERGFRLVQVSDTNWAQFRAPFKISDPCRKFTLKDPSLESL